MAFILCTEKCLAFGTPLEMLRLFENTTDRFQDREQTLIAEQTWTSVWEALKPSVWRWISSSPLQAGGVLYEQQHTDALLFQSDVNSMTTGAQQEQYGW